VSAPDAVARLARKLGRALSMSIEAMAIERICLVEDDPDHVTLISRAIREIHRNVVVTTLNDGGAALAWLGAVETLPDLILLDINMPGLSGFDVLSSVKQHDRLRRVPVVMLTSSDLASDVARAYELGASGYISKPSYLHDLRAVLGNTLLYWSAMRRAEAGAGPR
jgi:two-component system response regulator